MDVAAPVATKAPTVDPLHVEAALLARRVFGLELSAADAVRYAEANRELRVDQSDPTGTLRELLRVALARQADIESMEFVLRLRVRRNLVTQKLHILAFLLESDPIHLSRFVNERRRHKRALGLLAAHTLRAVGKYARGRWLLWRLGLAHA